MATEPQYLVVCSIDINTNSTFNKYRKAVEQHLDINFKADNTKFIDIINNKKAFPRDVCPDGGTFAKYDVIWFAGCNMLSWLGFSDNPELYKSLNCLQQICHENTLIVFTEAPKKIEVLKTHGFSVPDIFINSVDGLVPIKVFELTDNRHRDLPKDKNPVAIIGQILQLDPFGKRVYKIKPQRK